MSDLVLQLQSSNVWNKIYDEDRMATSITATTHTRIPAFEVGILINRHVLAVRCLSDTAKANWRFAGTLIQKFHIGSGGVASPLPIVEGARVGLRINRSRLIMFPTYVSSYGLILEPPFWFKDMQFTVWEYTGIISDTTREYLNLTKLQLDQIENKIDAL